MPLRRTSIASDGAPRKRRWLTPALVVAIGIVVLLVVPGVLAARPGFFGSFPALKDQHASWLTSTHAEVGCEGCHIRPSRLARATYRVRMVGEFYLSLVARSRRPDTFRTPTNEACLVCHSDLRSVSPKGDLQIPHRAHVTILKMQCVECHGYLVHERNPQGTHVPPMAECLDCHDGDRAEDACTACHTRKAAPANHGSPDWLVQHGTEASSGACASCHEWRDDWCVDCHHDRPVSHGTDWRAAHGDSVAQHRSCEACHDAEFCIRCHGTVPQLNVDPTLALVE